MPRTFQINPTKRSEFCFRQNPSNYFLLFRIDPKSLNQKTLDFVKDKTYFKDAYYDEVKSVCKSEQQRGSNEFMVFNLFFSIFTVFLNLNSSVVLPKCLY